MEEMNILIPMAGAGQRFADAGYKLSKPLIPTTCWRTGEKTPMVVAATKDLPGVKEGQIVYVDRDFHRDSGIEEEIKNFFPEAQFITIDYLTEGQASTCLLAKEQIDNEEELLIAGCDNGMVFSEELYLKTKAQCDAIIFTHRHHGLVLEKPEAYGWVKVDDQNNVRGMSVKKTISDNPLADHAVVATFWVRQGRDFVRACEKMIEEKDRINGEFYVDQVMQHMVDLGLKVKVLEVQRYLCWGTPQQYEDYESTLDYWYKFQQKEQGL